MLGLYEQDQGTAPPEQASDAGKGTNGAFSSALALDKQWFALVLAQVSVQFVSVILSSAS